MGDAGKIKLYDTPSFTGKFMSEELKNIVRSHSELFFISKLEEMYKLVTHHVPASRSTIHNCLFVTDGEAVMKIGSDLFRAGAGEMLFVPAGQVFSFGTGDVNKGYICGFHPDFLLGISGKNDLWKEFEFLRIWGNPKVKLGVEVSGFVLPLLQRLLAEYLKNGIEHHDLILSYLLTVFCEVKCAYQSPVSGGQTAALVIANRFRELIFFNIKSKQQVSDYAAMIHVSPNHLNKTVKAVTGKSPTKWIDEAIVSEAKILLCQSQLSISEIAMEVGFSDQSYFTRLFRKYEGVTPSDFRRLIEMS